MRDELEKFAAKTKTPPARTDRKQDAPAPEKQEDAPPPENAADDTPPPPPETKSQDADEFSDSNLPESAPAAPKAETKKEKVNPWRIVDQWKGRAAELEKQLAEAKSGTLPDGERKAADQRVAEYEKRIKDMEERLMVSDYKSSETYRNQFEKPYYDAYTEAQKRVGAMMTTEGEKAGPEVWDAIMNSQSDDAATEIIEQVFGNGVKASTVTQLREKVTELARNAYSNLKEKSEAGAKVLREQQEAMRRQMSEVHEVIAKNWEAANKSILDDPKLGEFFKQREGDPEWNQRLAKGFELTDRAFTENATDPSLTPEQRISVIKRHAAVRNRAAAFGALRFEVSRLQAKVSELETELSGYKSSEPGRGEGSGRSEAPQGAKSAWARMESELRSRAK